MLSRPILYIGEIMKLEPHVERLLAQRYYKPGEDWPKLVDRVVNNICEDEPIDYKEIIKEYLLNRVFLPNSPCLVNAGTKAGVFACFVVGPEEDSLEAHIEALGDIAAVAKAGGGCGFTGTFIRPENSPVGGSAHGYAYGPNNYALQVNNYMKMMTQSGFRMMALMATILSDHPDLDKFIELKQSGDESKGALFNQSVMATDSWMKEATEDINSKAHQQLKRLAYNSWNNGEPGLLFHTTINENTPYKTCGCTINATNPCGEQPLPSYGSCNLASINIAHNNFFNNDGYYNTQELFNVVRNVARFLDNVGSKNKFPNYKFSDWYEKHRPIGLGIMGYADALLKLKLQYGSTEALNFLDTIMEVIELATEAESEILGIERGIPDHCSKLNRRNSTLVSIAPTGSISFIADCSSGIEPIFAPTFTRTDERGETYNFELESAHEPYFMSAINDDSSKIVSWKEHIDTQLVSQKYVDSAISKTINMPNSATVEDVYEAMVYAWKGGAKGITTYRSGSRQKEVLTTKADKLEDNRYHPKRPEKVLCKIHKIKVNGDNWMILVGLVDDVPYELFAVNYEDKNIKSVDGTIIKVQPKVYNLVVDDYTLTDITKYNTDEQQALSRLVSLLLRSKMPMKFIIEQLTKSEGSVVSFSKGITRVLAEYNTETFLLRCPECNSKELVYESSCSTCKNCGYSRCG